MKAVLGGQAGGGAASLIHGVVGRLIKAEEVGPWRTNVRF